MKDRYESIQKRKRRKRKEKPDNSTDFICVRPMESWQTGLSNGLTGGMVFPEEGT